MIEAVGAILIDKFKDLPFMDRYAGVVRMLTRKGENGKSIKFPVSAQTSMAECDSGRYIDLIPNSRYKSVTYLEDRSLRFIKNLGGVLHWKANYDLICWLNLPLLGYDGTSYSAAAIAGIIKNLPVNFFNDHLYQQININVTGQQPKNYNPFSKYSYDEALNQFMLHPFDYFVLNFDVDFAVHQDCLSEMPIGDIDPCYEPQPIINYPKIKDQNGNLVKELKAGEVYIEVVQSGIINQQYVDPYQYIGKAPVDSDVSDSVWKITRIEIMDDGTVDVKTALNVKWTDRLTAIYS